VPFVSIEGVDGSGKTTQVEMLTQVLSSSGRKVVRTKEPDGGHLGKIVRAALTSERPENLSPMEEMLLITAARYDHVRSVIRPALLAGSWVVTDRFLDSTFAFQVYGGQVSEKTFDALTVDVVGDTLPDFTIVLDLPPHIAAQRRSSRSNGEDPAELERDFTRIRYGLLECARSSPRRCHIVDASSSRDEVAATIAAIVGLSAGACSPMLPGSEKFSV
jgi:dTMP kinase